MKLSILCFSSKTKMGRNGPTKDNGSVRATRGSSATVQIWIRKYVPQFV